MSHPSSSAHQPVPDWRLPLLLILALSLWRLLLAGLLPVTQDEAYYFDWAGRLGWGYFDHPPGVALLALGAWLAPGSALAARLGTLLAGALTLWVLARLYQRLGLREPRDLGLALLLAAATLPGFAGGLIATPDTPLALCWALALHEGERALAGDRRRWLGAGLATGLGFLGKYTMVLIGPVFLWAILRTDPRALRTPWPWLGGLLALLVALPHLAWNAGHDWLTLRFQFGHGFAAGVPPLAPDARLASVAGYLGAQLALWGLLLVPLLLAFLAPRTPVRAIGPTLAPHARPLLWAAALFPLGFFALVAAGGDVEANWPAMALAAAAPLAAFWLIRGGPRAWTLAAAGANLLLIGILVWQTATLALPGGDWPRRLLRETHGFAALARAVAILDAPVHADRYQDTAMLRFHLRAAAADAESARRLSATLTQWPGLTRPSEYARGRIAPALDPARVTAPFWLVSRRGAPPVLPGFAVMDRRALHDCGADALAESAAPPCRRPLQTWHLYRYAPYAPSG